MPAFEQQDIDLRERQSQYLDFLDDENEQGIYSDAIKHMVKQQSQRLVVNVNDLRKKLPDRAKALLENSVEEIILFQRALKDYVLHHHASYGQQSGDFMISFEGSFGNKHVTPRNLTSGLIGSIIAVEGIVTKCSLVHPKIARSTHYCPATKRATDRVYSDLTSLVAYPTTSVYPTKDEDGNLLETEYGYSTYIDHQTLTIQEMPEKAPAGQLPRSLDIIVDNDLVDQCKPGDRVLVVGPYRCLPNKQGYYTSGTFRTTLLATNINQMSKEVTAEITSDDINKCKRFSMQKNVFEVLARSLAPTICGYEYIKKALLCMLLGGLEKVLPNGTRLRGDINVLLIGDPSVSKSQLLRYVLHCAPRAVATTGRGSSGVGLTAAVTTDSETGDRRLEAGAMVLADRGVVCIDEFDKMTDIDRTAIHEVMEQGRVTITKAGIQAKLNARCSVLAAANPVYGRYDQYKTPMENIAMQDSLLSRFDLLFIMLDKNDRQADTEISDHIVRIHRYRTPGEQDGEPLPIRSHADFLSTKAANKLETDANDTIIYEKHDPLLHGKRNRREKIVTIDFMKKYIHIAKAIKPQLTTEAATIISQEYSKLRTFDLEQNDVARTQPITARTLETLIRLSTAHARARLSKVIETVDAKAAVEMVQYSHFKKVLEKPRKRRLNKDQAGDDSEESDFEEMEEESDTTAAPKAKKLTTTIEPSTDDVYDFAGLFADEPMESSASAAASVASPRQPIQLGENRLKQFRQFLFRLFRNDGVSTLTKEAVIANFKQEAEKPDGLQFSEAEIESALVMMQEQNQVFLSDNLIILV